MTQLNLARFLTTILAIAAFFFGGYIPAIGATTLPSHVKIFAGGSATETDASPQTQELRYPTGIDFDAQGNAWIVELSGGRVLGVRPSGELFVFAGTENGGYEGDGGPASEARFNHLHNLAISPDGTFFLSDSSNHCVRTIDSKAGRVETFAGSKEAGFAGDGETRKNARFREPICVTLTPDTKKLLIADIRNYRIRQIDLLTDQISTLAGNGKRGKPQEGALARESMLLDPRAVAADSRGNVYILERAGHILRMIDRQGRIFTVAGTGTRGFRDGPAMEATFFEPKHICVDARDRVYIADDKNNAIRLYDPQRGEVRTILGGEGEEGILKGPHGVCVHAGDLYIVDSGHNRVLTMDIFEETD